MCGRVKLPEDYSETKIQLSGEDWDAILNYERRFNIAPTDKIP
jgi:hypothetical protein